MGNRARIRNGPERRLDVPQYRGKVGLVLYQGSFILRRLRPDRHGSAAGGHYRVPMDPIIVQTGPARRPGPNGQQWD